MIGHGSIFERFRDGELHDDDEVAVVHASGDEGYRPLSQALVDLRDVYGRAVEAGVVAADLGAELVAAAQALPYPERDHRHVVDVVAARRSVPRAELDAFVAVSGPGLKARDARSLLELIAGTDLDDPAWRPAPVRVEPTVFLHRLHNEVHLERAAGVSPLPDPATRLRGLDTNAVLQKKVLTRLLARRLGELLEVPVDDLDLADALARFRARFDLADAAEFEAWRAREGVGEAALVEFLRDWTVLEKLQRQHTDDIDGMVADHLRIATARDRVEHPDDPEL